MNKVTRKSFIERMGIVGMGLAVFPKLINAQQTTNSSPIFILPKLPYAYNALEPYIDATTMEIHYTKHHQGYITNLIKAVANTKQANKPIEELVKNAGALGNAIRNNAGGHWNHSLFWESLKPNGGGQPKGKLSTAINTNFGSFENFKEKMNQAGLSRFGSGWVWLIKQNDKLVITSTPNQDNPLMDIAEIKGTPLLGIDVWEHAYYLKYQNKRADYLKALWNVINWDNVEQRFLKS